jgi:hypothetical protein
VEYHVAAGYGTTQRVVIAKIRFHQLDRQARYARTMAKIRGRNAYVKASIGKHLDKPPANKSGTTRHEYPIAAVHELTVHHHFLAHPWQLQRLSMTITGFDKSNWQLG